MLPKIGETLRCDRCDTDQRVKHVLNTDAFRMECGHMLYRNQHYRRA